MSLKKTLFFIVLSILTVALGACSNEGDGSSKEGGFFKSKPKSGMNEINQEQMEEKFKNKETFLLLSYVEDQEDIDRTNFIKAYDQALKEYDLVGYYVNLDGLSKDEQEYLVNKYEHPDSDRFGNGNWSPSFAELTLAVDGLIGLENGYGHGRRDWLKGDKDFFDEMEDIYDGIKELMAYMSVRNISLDD